MLAGTNRIIHQNAVCYIVPYLLLVLKGTLWHIFSKPLIAAYQEEKTILVVAPLFSLFLVGTEKNNSFFPQQLF